MLSKALKKSESRKETVLGPRRGIKLTSVVIESEEVESLEKSGRVKIGKGSWSPNVIHAWDMAI